MTLLKLQSILGTQIEKIIDEKASSIAHKKALEDAVYIAKLAKQMINNADVCVRTDKLANRHDRADKILGEYKSKADDA